MANWLLGNCVRAYVPRENTYHCNTAMVYTLRCITLGNCFTKVKDQEKFTIPIATVYVNWLIVSNSPPACIL